MPTRRLVEADQEGIARHVAAICKSVKIGVIVYNRNVCRLGPDVLEKLVGGWPMAGIDDLMPWAPAFRKAEFQRM